MPYLSYLPATALLIHYAAMDLNCIKWVKPKFQMELAFECLFSSMICSVLPSLQNNFFFFGIDVQFHQSKAQVFLRLYVNYVLMVVLRLYHLTVVGGNWGWTHLGNTEICAAFFSVLFCGTLIVLLQRYENHISYKY